LFELQESIRKYKKEKNINGQLDYTHKQLDLAMGDALRFSGAYEFGARAGLLELYRAIGDYERAVLYGKPMLPLMEDKTVNGQEGLRKEFDHYRLEIARMEAGLNFARARDKGQYDTAIDHANRMIEYAKRTREPTIVAEAYVAKYSVLWEKYLAAEDFDKAIEYADRMVEYAKQTGDPAFVAEAYLQKYSTLREKHLGAEEFDRAIGYANRMVEYAKQTDDSAMVAIAQGAVEEANYVKYVELYAKHSDAEQFDAAAKYASYMFRHAQNFNRIMGSNPESRAEGKAMVLIAELAVGEVEFMQDLASVDNAMADGQFDRALQLARQLPSHAKEYERLNQFLDQLEDEVGSSGLIETTERDMLKTAGPFVEWTALVLLAQIETAKGTSDSLNAFKQHASQVAKMAEREPLSSIPFIVVESKMIHAEALMADLRIEQATEELAEVLAALETTRGNRRNDPWGLADREWIGQTFLALAIGYHGLGLDADVAHLLAKGRDLIAEAGVEIDPLVQANLHVILGEYSEAVQIYKSLRAPLLGKQGLTHLERRRLARIETQLALCLVEMEHFDEADALRAGILGYIGDRVLSDGAGGASFGSPVGLLVDAYLAKDRFAEAETLARASLEANDNDWECRQQLAEILDRKGRHTEAVAQNEKAMEGYSQAFNIDALPNLVRRSRSQLMSSSRSCLAMEGAQDFINELAQRMGKNSLWTIEIRAISAADYAESGETEAARKQLALALSAAKAYGDSLLPSIYVDVADAYRELKQYQEAITYYESALSTPLDMYASFLGPLPPGWKERTHVQIAYCLALQGKRDEALRKLASVVIQESHRERAVRSRTTTATTYRLCGESKKALAHLRRAMELVRELREVDAANTPLDAAYTMSATGVAQVIQEMIACLAEKSEQVGERDLAEGFDAMEQGRAQILLNQMRRQRMDWTQGLEPDEVERLQEQVERQNRRRISLRNNGAEPEELRNAEWELLLARTARISANPAYIRAVSVATPVSLAAFRDVLARSPCQTWALDYLIGEEQSYVLIVPPSGGPSPVFLRLDISENAAHHLGTAPGPLTARTLRSILHNEQATGVLDFLSNPKKAESQRGQLAREELAKLHALWQLLVPDERLRRQFVSKRSEAARDRSIERLLVLPDGPLASLPFQSLVPQYSELTPGDSQFLLDCGPTIQYAPSATVYCKLQEQSADPQTLNVLTVGVQDYSGRNELVDLPNTARETAHVEALVDGLPSGSATRLFGNKGENASESQVRANIEGKTILHFACHGRAEKTRFGNMFGCLELYPAESSDIDHDGSLELHEMCEHDLTTCELTVLSACETNLGAVMSGEGAWTLSRAFIAAGAKRTVATNWFVDDLASSELVCQFFDHLLKPNPQESRLQYAEALRMSQLAIRGGNGGSNPEWQHPYYWAPFTLIGP